MNNDWRNELITKGAAFDALKDNMFRLTLAEEQRCEGHVVCGEYVVFADVFEKALLSLPSAQPETYKEKLKEIADALSEKFAYMHTCLNERDIILGYLGVKHSNEIHCNTDCTNIKCESYRFNKRLPSAQPVAKDINVLNIEPRKKGKWINRSLNIMYPEWERYTCSVCGKHSNNYDFCPHCGADMRGGEDA